MSRGASKVVNTCMKVQPGEQILIVTELSRLSIAQALAAEVYRVGAEPAVCIMEPRTQDSQEPPKEIAAAMLASDGFLSVVGKSITHTQAVKSCHCGRLPGAGADPLHRRDDGPWGNRRGF